MPEGAAEGASQAVAAIGGEGHPAFGEGDKGSETLPSAHVPQAHGGVQGAGGERLSVRRERHAQDAAPMAWSLRRSAPVPTSHRRTVSSKEPEAMRLPSGENDTLKTLPPWPWSMRRSAPVPTSHRRTVSSSEPEASVFPSGENDTL